MKHFLYNSYAKKLPKHYKRMVDMTTIENDCSFKHVHLFGGDGTLNSFVNNYKVSKITLYKKGSGNDFYRSLKKTNNSWIYSANDLKFINGFGTGIDAVVCDSLSKNKNYLKTLLKTLKEFKTFDLEINIDAKSKKFSNCHSLIVNNGKYIGGGFKVAPKANIEDPLLDVVVVHNLSKVRIAALLFLLIFGKHYLLKKSVYYTKASNIDVLNTNILYQIDGEVHTSDKPITISKYRKITVNKNRIKM